MLINIFKDKTILITGASGFIGSSLLKYLYDNEVNIIAVVHKTKNIDLPIQTIEYDGSFESLSNSLIDKEIDLVLHLATLFIANHKSDQISDIIDANIKFGAHILELTKQKKIPAFINTSTYATNFKHEGYNPQNFYAATKQSFFDLIKYYQETTNTVFITLEMTDTYGPGDTRPKFINLVLDAISNQQTFKMSLGEQEICYLYIDDAVNAFAHCIMLLIKNEIEINSSYSVYSNEVFQLIDLVSYVSELSGYTLETERGFYPYRDREIMTYKPTYPKLVGWESKVMLKEGINNIRNKK